LNKSRASDDSKSICVNFSQQTTAARWLPSPKATVVYRIRQQRKSKLIQIPTHPLVHLAFDMAAYVCAGLAARSSRGLFRQRIERLARISNASYFISLAVGALLGAWFFGSLNSLSWKQPTLSHSLAGALVGGIFAVEIWKWKHDITESTGITFVIPVCAGIVVGRIGCLFSGLADHTFGTESTHPWAVDLGDGIARHPVQLYESFSVLLFLGCFLLAIIRKNELVLKQGFYLFTGFYAVQRFTWEFLKPYPVQFHLNVFQWLMVLLFMYSILFAQRKARTR
jgi:phosphatidylglycerol---prolipoprotein diacylglyceryl transferase